MTNNRFISDNDKNILDRYFKSISKYKILDKEEETKIAKLSFEKHDLTARNKLINHNLKFVIKIAYKYKGYVDNKNITFFDLIQAGNIGLIYSAEKFDPSFGVRFISYAAYWITAKIRLFIADHSHIIKIATTTAGRALFFKRRIISKYLELDLDDRENCKEEMTKQYSGFNQSDMNNFIDKLDVVENMVKLDNIIPNTKELENFHNISTNRENNIQNDQYMKLEHNDTIKKLRAALLDSIKNLKPKQKEVISKRFFSSDANDKQITLEQIGKETNVCRERVRQIEKVALEEMKKHIVMNNKWLVDQCYD